MCRENIKHLIFNTIYTGSPAEGSSIHERAFRQNGRNTFQPIEIVTTSDACGVTGSVSRDVIRGNSVLSCHLNNVCYCVLQLPVSDAVL